MRITRFYKMFAVILIIAQFLSFSVVTIFATPSEENLQQQDATLSVESIGYDGDVSLEPITEDTKAVAGNQLEPILNNGTVYCWRANTN